MIKNWIIFTLTEIIIVTWMQKDHLAIGMIDCKSLAGFSADHIRDDSWEISLFLGE